MSKAINSSPMIISTLKVSGLDCPDCAKDVQKAVSSMPGVQSAEVNFGAQKLKVVYNNEVSVEQISKVLSKIGHTATVLSENRESNKTNSSPIITSTLKVSELCCPDSAKDVKKAVSSMPGVQSTEVNFNAQKLKVVYNSNETSLEQISNILSKIGHPVTSVKTENVENAKAAPSKNVEAPSEYAKNAKVAPLITPWWKETKNVLLAISAVITVLTLIAEWTHIGLSETWAKVLYGTAVIIGGIFPAKKGLSSLKHGRLTINTLLVVGAIGAIYLGLWEEASLLVVIFSLGEVLESYAVDKARGSIQALISLAPQEATVLRNGKELRVPIEQVNIDEIVLVKPGEKVSVDGVVVSGTSAIDQSSITGESIPIEKHAGDGVYASTLNGRGALEIKVTKLAEDSTLSKIVELVENAQMKKGAAQNFSERFGAIYTPFMFVLAIIMAIVPPVFFGQPFDAWLYRALVVLVVSCSCSLVLSVPIAIVAGVGNAAKNGVLVKGGIHMETAGKVQVVAFDKTGTLTTGKPTVTDLVALGSISDEKLLKIAGTLEVRSEHPLADAILKLISEKGLELETIDEFMSITGRGAKGMIDGEQYYIGNPRLFKEIGVSVEGHIKQIESLQDEGKTVILVGNSKQILGMIAVSDQPKGNARKAISKLKELGIKKIVMLTGDNKVTGKAIGRRLGVDEVRAELLPEDKISAIKALQQGHSTVAMVGDGVNDAPALAQADVGVSMGVAGTDVALETADIALMADDLDQLVYMVKISRKTVSVIKQNIAFSLALVAFLVITALFGWMPLTTGLIINEASALVIIANGVRLLKVKQS
ncbi:heavy metal translocating P-type ATPase [Sinanaerobacter chloroacetimidivorans]|uniref:Cd(2+)-exporting ATPase n=1 Tax=Sinanaerobacter chloroacetimidivorans TaxID=2818044 RepID=A0A8J7W383_9FIRM|nr:heavy metal translocating P-type ATPase [Sinanaerobacter chloroacetimidivorans]MBR0600062.1 heavy metal translocating P-type ATPase [Sinanaerobacter chloroacetimidivorans]